jgi:hypothetical protein
MDAANILRIFVEDIGTRKILYSERCDIFKRLSKREAEEMNESERGDDRMEICAVKIHGIDPTLVCEDKAPGEVSKRRGGSGVR